MPTAYPQNTLHRPYNISDHAGVLFATLDIKFVPRPLSIKAIFFSRPLTLMINSWTYKYIFFLVHRVR